MITTNNTSYDTEDLMLIKLKWIKNKKIKVYLQMI